jgi:hypothetical protein
MVEGEDVDLRVPSECVLFEGSYQDLYKCLTVEQSGVRHRFSAFDAVALLDVRAELWSAAGCSRATFQVIETAIRKLKKQYPLSPELFDRPFFKNLLEQETHPAFKVVPTMKRDHLVANDVGIVAQEFDSIFPYEQVQLLVGRRSFWARFPDSAAQERCCRRFSRSC